MANNENIRKLRKLIQEEYQEFKNICLNKSKEEIFFNCFKIYFYNEIYEFFQNDYFSMSKKDILALLEDGNHIVELLFNCYIDTELSSISNFEDINYFIIAYNDKYHSDIVKDRYNP